MDKEFEELKNIVIVHFGALGFLNLSENEQILKDRDKVLDALDELKQIKESKPSEAMKIFCRERTQGEFIDGFPTGNIYVGMTKEEFEVVEQALLKAQELEDENNILREQNNDLYGELELANKQYKELVECAKQQSDALKIIKEKCLHTDNLNYVATYINYDVYKEKMSKKYDTVVVKIDWNDKVLLDYLKLLTQEEFDLLKKLVEGIRK